MTVQLDMEWLSRQVEDFDERVVFAAVSGAHLYGFPSRDSDVDVRGAHMLPTEEVLRLEEVEQTRDFIDEREGVEFDLSSHELGKFLRLLLDRNATVLEQLYSPHVIVGGEALERMKALATRCLTRHHYHHYHGFARSRWSRFVETGRMKPLLYCYRACLTGRHLLTTGELVSDLEVLARECGRQLIVDLVDEKRRGEEKMDAPDMPERLEQLHDDLVGELDAAFESSSLREAVSAETHAAVSDFLVDMRLGYIHR